jgi:DNA (cytosine-5)-methyltransferase 1
MTHGSLFAGIGGFDLGFERAGIKTVWQVECDPYCQRVLARHFPEAQRYADIRLCVASKNTLPRTQGAALPSTGAQPKDELGPSGVRGWLSGYDEQELSALDPVDIISGGFPCQDISNAGKRAGIYGERSGLWSEYARIIRELRPRYVVVENVAALLNRGMERVLGDLAACGYDAEWQSIRASDVGAPHRRERIWIVAYPRCQCQHGIQSQRTDCRSQTVFGNDGEAQSLANTAGERCRETRTDSERRTQWLASGSDALGDSYSQRCANLQRCDASTECKRSGTISHSSWWNAEPDVGRVAHGIPARVDRLKGLGNAVVPQIAEWIGRRIVESVMGNQVHHETESQGLIP